MKMDEMERWANACALVLPAGAVTAERRMSAGDYREALTDYLALAEAANTLAVHCRLKIDEKRLAEYSASGQDGKPGSGPAPNTATGYEDTL